MKPCLAHQYSNGVCVRCEHRIEHWPTGHIPEGRARVTAPPPPRKSGPKPINRPRFQGGQRCRSIGRVLLYAHDPRVAVEDEKRCMGRIYHEGLHGWGTHQWA